MDFTISLRLKTLEAIIFVKLAENSEKVAITHYKFELNGLYYLDKELNAAGEVVNDSLSK
ncbi:hypothetical protein FGF1_14250 [Flavobacteriaceae bacterium GF1]